MLTGFRIFSPFLIQWHFLFKLERKIHLRHFPIFFPIPFFKRHHISLQVDEKMSRHLRDESPTTHQQRFSKF